MAIDLIKQYLVGIGFNVDTNSLNDAEKSISKADKTIKDFNENSNKGFSESADVIKDFFTLLSTSSGSIGKLFPELQTPFKNFIKDIIVIQKLYNDLSNTKIKPKTELETESKNSDNRFKTSNTQSTKSTTNTQKIINVHNKGLSIIPKNTELCTSNLVENILSAKDAAKGLATEGGEAFEAFSVEALGGLGAITAGIATLVAAVAIGTVELAKYLNGLAKQDIEYEKLSRQLWTTKENAKEVDMALKTLGVSMQDLWLSPTLLKQFNQLRQDSKELKLPKEYTENLKFVQGIGLELLRLKQLGQLAFQWIGNSILKYAAGPLKEFKQGMKSFNDWIVKNMPEIAKQIGVPLGILIRGIFDIIQLFALMIEKSPFGQIIKWINSLPEPVKNTVRKISLLIQPLIFILALLDDVMTYFKSGKSLTGTFLDKVSKSFDSIGEKIKNVIAWFKKFKDEIMNSSIVKGLEGFKSGIEEGINDIGKVDFKGLLGDLNTKINGVSASNMNNAVSNYTTSNIRNMTNSSTTTQNSHNSTVKNENKIYVYGGSDANSTGKAVKNNLNGITLRNLQGVY